MQKSFNVNELAAIIAKHLGVKSATIEEVGTNDATIPIGKGAVCDMTVSLSDEPEECDETTEPAILYGIITHLRSVFTLQQCYCDMTEGRCDRCATLALIKRQLELIPMKEKPEYMELMGDATYMEMLEDTALKSSFYQGLAMQEAYRDLSKAARTVWALLSMANLCETCRLRVKDSHYCDASSCIKHRAVRCQHFEVNQ